MLNANQLMILKYLHAFHIKCYFIDYQLIFQIDFAAASLIP